MIPCRKTLIKLAATSTLFPAKARKSVRAQISPPEITPEMPMSSPATQQQMMMMGQMQELMGQMHQRMAQMTPEQMQEFRPLMMEHHRQLMEQMRQLMEQMPQVETTEDGERSFENE